MHTREDDTDHSDCAHPRLLFEKTSIFKVSRSLNVPRNLVVRKRSRATLLHEPGTMLISTDCFRGDTLERFVIIDTINMRLYLRPVVEDSFTTDLEIELEYIRC